MDRQKGIQSIRNKLGANQVSIGSWMQIPSSDVAEIMGQAGFDWVAIDLEHGSIGEEQLPDLFRSLELGGTLPLARIPSITKEFCKNALDAGAAGLILPMVEDSEMFQLARDFSCWPPVGNRGVGFSRANLFGKNFEAYVGEAQAPILVAQIEHIHAVEKIKSILASPGLDAVFVGPYDLSASMGLTGQLDHPDVIDALRMVLESCSNLNVCPGIHLVAPDEGKLLETIELGYRFIAYSIDAVFLHNSISLPKSVAS